jgi:hypothetical protein
MTNNDIVQKVAAVKVSISHRQRPQKFNPVG